LSRGAGDRIHGILARFVPEGGFTMSKRAYGADRRGFLGGLAAGIVGAIGFPALRRANAAGAEPRVFGSQFLEGAQTMTVPSGHYDPERKIFVEDGTGEPMFAQQQQRLTSTNTPCSYSTCRAYDSNNNCTRYDDDRCTPPLDFNESDV